MQPRSKQLGATIGTIVLIGIVLAASVQAAFATPAESPKESYLANVNYAAGISMGMAVSRAFANGEPFSDETFREMLKKIIRSDALMACRTVECRMKWGAKFAEAVAKRAMAKKANLPHVPDARTLR